MEEAAREVKRLAEQLVAADRKDLLLRAIGVPMLEELRLEAAKGRLSRLVITEDFRFVLACDTGTVTLFQTSRLFYNCYPQIGNVIYATASHKLSHSQICAMPSHKFETSAKDLLSKLSFSHIREIMTQDDPLVRFFYETECIKGTWSVRELRRQIATNLYFRSGVSKDPKKLLSTLEPETNTPALTIRQHFTFGFLGLKAKDVITESDLEDALIDHLRGWPNMPLQAWTTV